MKTVKVWDPLIRVMHWSLAIVFLVNFIDEGGDPLHNWLGYAALFLVGARVVLWAQDVYPDVAEALGVRVVWGWIGPQRARFADWVRGPRAVRNYLRERLAGRSRRQLGHNPAAAAMMVALLIGVAIVGLTGWLQTTDRFFGVEWIEELHEVLAYGVLVMVGLHVAAAISESMHYRENLIASMIHGRKRALEDDHADVDHTS